MEPGLSTINQSPVVACRLVWRLMNSPWSIREATPLPAF